MAADDERTWTTSAAVRTTSMAADDERARTTSAAVRTTSMAADDERTWTTSVTVRTTSMAADDERARTTSAAAAKEGYATSTTAAEKKHVTSTTAAEEKHSTNKMTAWERRDEQNIATAATLVKQDEKTNVAVDMGHLESSQRRMVIKTRPARELDPSRGETGETSEGVLTDGWTERETRGDWSHLYGPEYCYVCWSESFRMWVFECEL